MLLAISKQRRAKTSLQAKGSTLPSTVQEDICVLSSCSGSGVMERMSGRTNPVAIGTRGTVGSLIMQEISYFSRLEIGGLNSCSKPRHQLANFASKGEYAKPKLESVIAIPGKKKWASRRLIPSVCAIVEIAESHKPNGFSGFTYRNLKADLKRYQT